MASRSSQILSKPRLWVSSRNSRSLAVGSFDGERAGELVAGACFVAIHNALGALLERRWSLPKNGRRPRHATGGVLR